MKYDSVVLPTPSVIGWENKKLQLEIYSPLFILRSPLYVCIYAAYICIYRWMNPEHETSLG